MNNNPRNIRLSGSELYFLPVETRVPLKFGTETLTSVICARVRVTVTLENGESASGWGETPLNVQWVWPSGLPYSERLESLKSLCRKIQSSLVDISVSGHPMEIGHDLTQNLLVNVLEQANDQGRHDAEPIPWLAALVCLSAFDIAIHDAYGAIHNVDIYQTYQSGWMNRDLSTYLEPSESVKDVDFHGLYPSDFLVDHPQEKLMVWHLVGGLDPLEPDELTGHEPDDGHPVLLRDWIHQDDLKCLKIKLRGNDRHWDFERIVHVGKIAEEMDLPWLTADFNCTVSEPAYVNGILDDLKDNYPAIYGKLLYVEQPFPYDLEHHAINVKSVAARKPIFLDESAHDWQVVKLGYHLGWTGVALKTCKTQTGALLSACWAKAHGMTLMVQDLTNPMLAQIPHCRLAAQVGTIMGVESNAMQFYPDASLPELEIHPGLYQRNHGILDLASLAGPGFGYRLSEITRDLPDKEIAG